MFRQALIKRTNLGIEETATGQVTVYLPSDYTARVINDDTVMVEGTDYAGWTLDGYVLPRLASGMMYGEEVK